MLWSDPKDEPPVELRDAEARLRRLGLVLALATVFMLVVVWSVPG